MKFQETKLAGAYIVDLNLLQDERGFFSRIFCRNEFEQHGLVSDVVQGNMSWNRSKGTLRGMHFQYSPYQETKFIRCVRGAIYDVIIDLRKDSPTYKQWIGVELTADNRTALFVPKDFAHGFITLQDDTEVFYLVSQSYQPGSEGGIRWNDPQFQIEWPLEPTCISAKDAAWPDYEG
ncbi:dTDP-4-dehydrorhamnose 3,5-epimerase [Saccharophagus sp. K07]|jgi:dTDP-4-dehydrorhamnose 3,5-epimerase|uniref:dTDP-4-dehydrorhamnose 3,5-epimerase n=1 Tax=Saccharophagus sp. K07 TaxID=2283636 RepID=UPI0016527A98|nr:dTDP-4-dehydrorhamnose 3,5-epimerase [Saccharophagus sp. K07]MBC6903957.1 dTDP-4-dehydrorhamnose 3,5-epimerase [Saccharophagus sp. K07]